MKIVSMRSLGVRQTYSPEMASARHNYITDRSRAVHANSHAVAYCLVAYRCLYLKARFPCEWWAAVMSDCHPDKLVRYMAVAKAEGAVFHSFNINNLTVDFGVKGDSVTLGLIGLKKVGRNMAEEFVGHCDPLDVDEFVAIKGKNKTVLERLIKLGAFDHLDGHHNRKAVWTWYQFKYCSGKDITQLKKDIKRRLIEADGWTEESIAEERQEQIRLYKSAYPKRSNVPKKILEWQPDPDPTRERVLKLLCGDHFTTDELLTFEKQYLGYYMSNPLDRYEYNQHCSFSEAREYGYGRVHGIVREVDFGMTKKGKEMCRLRVFDGQEQHLILLWDDDCERYRKVLEEAKESLARPDAGTVRHESAMEVKVKYSPKTSKFPESYTIWKEPKFKNYGAYTRPKSDYDLEMRGEAVRILPLKEA